MNGQDNRVKVITDLLARAQHNTTPEPEAEACFVKAQELMTKWAIDDVLLEAAGKIDRDELAVERLDISGSYFKSNLALLSRIAQANDLKVVHMPQRARGYGGWAELIGFRRDIDRVTLLYASLAIHVARTSRYVVKPAYESCSPYVYRKSFRFGFANGIGARLEAVKVKVVQDQTPGTGIVLADRGKQVDAYLTQVYPSLVQGKASRMGWSESGARAGREESGRADIGQSRIGGHGKEIGR